MKLFQSDYLKLRRASPTGNGHKFLTFLVDGLIMFLLAYGVFWLFFLGVSNSSTYANYQTIIEEEVSYYYEKMEETHLYYRDSSGDLLDVEVTAVKLIAKTIVNSYEHYSETGQATDWDKPEGAYTEAENLRADFTNDNIAYFYTVYVPANNGNDDIMTEPEEGFYSYFIAQHKAAFGDTASSLFVYDGDSYPVLTKSYAVATANYLYGGVDDDVGKEFYTTFVSAVEGMVNDAETLFLNGKTYQAEHYVYYNNAFLSQAQMVSLSLFFSTLISFIVYKVFCYFLQDCASLGMKIFVSGCVTVGREPTTISNYLRRLIVPFFEIWLIPFFIMALPPFNMTFTLLYSPLFYIGSFALCLGYLALFAVLVLAVNGSVAFFTHDKRSLSDLIAGTINVDKRYQDEDDTDLETDAPL